MSSPSLRVGFLGPRGTFSEQALLESAGEQPVALVPLESIHATVLAVQEGGVPRAVVPIENSTEGPVTVTLDALVAEAPDVVIVGEVVVPVSYCLVARRDRPLEEFARVLAHPQAAAQCAAFLRRALPRAVVNPGSSNAQAVQAVAQGDDDDVVALGPRVAADLYGGVILREGVQDEADNVTRFVWLARRDGLGDTRSPSHEGTTHKTALVFWGPGDTGPGWLVSCLDEFARRGLNLTRIESRPRRRGLGHYLFFADIEGAADDPPLAAAIAGVRSHCEEVRLLGSYPVG
ncbi:MAG TPA: prephenate dehydratase [Solirubrobacteraceae bacterium]|nr:prephenate dehydratase [Solirubrobacteraceae bacterium]